MHTTEKKEINLSELIARLYGLTETEVSGSNMYATDLANYRQVWFERNGDEVKRVWHENLTMVPKSRISVKEITGILSDFVDVVEDVK